MLRLLRPSFHLIFTSIANALAGPRHTAILQRSSTSESLVPSCAQACLEDFISSSFPASTCPAPAGLDCLCSSKSNSGLTLGEGALRCVASDCPNERQLDLASAYGICLSIPNAQPMTHLTITATMPASTSIQANGRLLSIASVVSSATLILSSASATSISASTAMSTSLVSSSTIMTGLAIDTAAAPTPWNVMTATASASSASSTSSASTNDQSQPGVSTGQVAGIAVAASVLLAVVAAFVLYLLYRRRLRKRPTSGSSFGGDEAPLDQKRILTSELSHFNFPAPPKGHSASRSISTIGTRGFVSKPGSISTRGPPDWTRGAGSTAPRPAGNRSGTASIRNASSEEVGLAVSRRMTQDLHSLRSVASIASFRTTSNLLPENPAHKAHPPLPGQIAQPVNPVSLRSTDQALPRSEHAPSRSTRSRASTSASHDPRTRHLATNSTSSGPLLPTQPRSTYQPANSTSHKPLPPPNFTSTRLPPSHTRPSPSRPTPSPLRYNERRASEKAVLDDTTAASLPFSPPVPPKAWQPLRQRSAISQMTGSDTSFEDDVGDVESPRLEALPQHHFASLDESSNIGRIGLIRYPLIPGKMASPMRTLDPSASRSPPSIPQRSLDPVPSSTPKATRYELPASEYQPRASPHGGGSEGLVSPLSPHDDGLAASWQILGGAPIKGLEKVGPWGYR